MRSVRGAMARLWMVGACVAGCASAPAPQETGAPRCDAPQAQRVLSYCLSPSAAEYAREVEQKRVVLRAGEVDPQTFPLSVGSSPTLGPANAPVTVVIFSDLECPYCADAHAKMLALQGAMPTQVRLVFKHFPLGMHPEAKPAAAAAMAAHAQGKFWEFVAMAFARQESLSATTYETIATELGLDLAAFNAARQAPDALKPVEQDQALGKFLQVSGTPTIYLNGVPVPASVPLEQLREVVAQQATIADAFIAAGVPPQEVYWSMVMAQYRPMPEAAETDEDEGPSDVAYIPVLDSPQRGASEDSALVTIIVFSDFECPFCASANPPLEAALAKHAQLRIVFKHFPLPFHERADNAAGAAIIAAREGKFWQLHDLLFASQDDLSDEQLRKLATQAGVKADVIEAMKAPDVAEVIRRDMTMGVTAGVGGTPTLLINGLRLVGAPDETMLDALIQQQSALAGELKRADPSLKAEALHEALVMANDEGEGADGGDDQDSAP